MSKQIVYYIAAVVLHRRCLSLETTNANIPALEMKALLDLYGSTDGENWFWDDESYGIPWDFAAGANPCTDHWQGINCTLPAPYTTYHITEIELYGYLMKGTLPNTLHWLTELVYLNLYANEIWGTIPSCLGNMTDLEYLSLGINRFSGPLPATLGNLTNLIYFDLQKNKLSGPVPDNYANLFSLGYLYLANNQLSGSIPAFLGSLTEVVVMYLTSNTFTGSLPASVGNLTQLAYFECDTCGIHGTIPETYGQLVGLQTIVFGNNALTGRFPHFLNNIPTLYDIELANTLLTGTLPSNLNLPYMIMFQVGNCLFHGPIPHQYDHMVNLNVMDFSMNAFSGTLPSSFGRLNYLGYFYADNNKLTGTIPTTFAQLISLEVLQVQNNQLSGTLDHVFDPALQTALDTVVLDHNQLTGQLPAYLFHSQHLRIFSGVQNCFHGTVPESVCDGKNLVALILDGLTSGTSCRYKISPAISSSYITWSGVRGTVPSCLFQLPNITTLHLSGNRLTGSISADLQVSDSLYDLTLSHNVLTGSIPVQIQQRQWYNLDLSYNRFAGTVVDDLGSRKFNFSYFEKVNGIGLELLFLLLNKTIHGNVNVSTETANVQTKFSLENNRLSGKIPAAALDRSTISILGTNMFSCELNGDGLPRHDPGRRNYQCGSSAFDIPYYIWLALCGAIFGTVAVVFAWRQRFETNIGIAYVMAHWSKWLDFSKVDLKDRNGLLLFEHFVTFISKLSLLTTGYALVILLPLYSALSSYYGIMTYEYAWTVSAAFMSGAVPSALEIGLWTTLLLAVVAFAHLNVKTLKTMALSEPCQEHANPPPLNSMSCNAASIIVQALYIAVNLVVVVGVNVAYVYIAIYESSELLIIAQVLMSFFKLIWNAVCTSWILRAYVDYVTGGLGEAGRRHHESDFVSLQVFVALLNNIIIPCCVVVTISPSCFYYVFVSAPTVESSYIYKSCAILDGDGKCYLYRLHQESTSYVPPYSYNYQCSSSLITYYAPAYVNMCIVSAIFSPATQFALQQLHRRAGEGTLWFRLLDSMLPRLLKPLPTAQINSVESVPPGQPAYFIINRLYISLLTFIGLLLTFGVAFPPLALSLCVTVLVNAYFSKLKVGRFLYAAEEQKLPHLIDRIDRDCQAVGSVPVLLHHSMWMMVIVACLFYTLFLFDTLGDAVGLEGAYWVLIVMPLLPLCFFLVICLYDESARSVEKSNAHEVQVEVGVGPGTEKTTEFELVSAKVTQNPLVAARESV